MSLAPNDLFTHLLPQWQFEERHHRLLRVSPAAALAAAAAYRPDGDRLIAGLIALREWPGRLAAALGRPNALGQRAAFGFDDFTPIGQDTEHLAFGLVGRFWEADYGLRGVPGGDAFRTFSEPGTARLLLGFHVEPAGVGTRLSTLTRIHCPDAASLARMRRYWRVIRPASGLIRRRMLARIDALARTG